MNLLFIIIIVSLGNLLVAVFTAVVIIVIFRAGGIPFGFVAVPLGGLASVRLPFGTGRELGLQVLSFWGLWSSRPARPH